MRRKPKITAQVATICHDIRRRREELGLTQDQLADRSGLTPNYIGNIELGRRDPSLTSIEALAIGLNVSPGELFGSPLPVSAVAREVAQLFEKASPEMQKALLSLLRVCAPKVPRS